jgi:transcriptional repressor NrdR
MRVTPTSPLPSASTVTIFEPVNSGKILGLLAKMPAWWRTPPDFDLPAPMKCPFCGFENDKVVDSRESKEADSIRRRRECLKCGKRFTTYERIDEIPYMVVKKDGRREKFDRQKVLNGLLRACEKRPVPISKLEQIVNEAEGFVIESPERERKTSELGELIMNRLRRYDKVAYVRFASVYLDFKDVKEFMNELKDLVKAKSSGQ